MGQYDKSFSKDMVLTEVSALVGGSVETGRIISVNCEAEQIARHYPDSGMTEEEISEAIAALAATRRVPIDTSGEDDPGGLKATPAPPQMDPGPSD